MKVRNYPALLHLLSNHRSFLLLFFLGNVRFDGEQVLLGFPDCFIFFLHDLGLLVVLGGFFFLIYSCHKKEGEEGRRRKNSSSPG